MKRMPSKPRIVVICGPTGSGKTSLAASLCKKFGGEIVNADSRQVYQGMDIGTSKELDVNPKSKAPNNKQISNHKFQTIRGISVHLVNIVDSDKRYSVGQFKKDAERVIADILRRGKVPFLVGGTGLYIDALVENFQLPAVGAALCGRPNPGNHIGLPLQDLVKQLLKIDPACGDIVDLKNRRRVERALEFCLATGKKFSESRKKGERKYEVLKIAPLDFARGKPYNMSGLYEKINKRVDEMINQGLGDEVRRLAKKYGWDSEAMTGIGYREWREYLTAPVGADPCVCPRQGEPACAGRFGGSPLQGVINKIKQNTRNYAKRQMTWFRRDKRIKWVGNVKQAEKLIKSFLSK